jgi:hypothetical protein
MPAENDALAACGRDAACGRVAARGPDCIAAPEGQRGDEARARLEELARRAAPLRINDARII